MTRAACLLIFSLLLSSGCDLVAEDDAIEISGVVIDASRQQPLAGMGLALKTGGWAGGVARAQTLSAADGSFRLRVDDPGQRRLFFRVNSSPYDEAYHTFWEDVPAGHRSVRRVEIHQMERLTVSAETDRPLVGDDFYMIWLPCTGGQSPLTTHCARGNAYNEVRLVVQRNGVQHERVEQVYCPVDTETVYTIRY